MQKNLFPLNRNKQQGVALFTALMLLLITTIIGIASVRTGVMEAQMSTNEELRIAAFETAESIVDSVAADSTLTLEVTGDVGRSVCRNWATPCDVTNLDINDDLEAAVNPYQTQLQAKIIRGDLSPPLPADETSDCIQWANFRVQGRYDGRPVGQGLTEVRRGLRIPVPVDC